jgi:hypothetical protein
MLAFLSCSDDHVQAQKANVVITAEPGSQRGHHCRTRKPTWLSLQDQEANVIITAGPENQRAMITTLDF